MAKKTTVKIEITGDARKLKKATDQGERDLKDFAGTFRTVSGGLRLDASSLYSSRGDFEKAGKAVVDSLEQGLEKGDPGKAIDLDASSLYSSRGDFEKAGRELGEAVGDGARQGAKGSGRKVGEEVGRDVGDGVGSGIASSGTEAASEALGGLLDELPIAAGGPAAVAGGLVAAAIISGIRTNLEQESIGDVLAARAGVDNAAAEMFGEVAGELYADGFGGSITEVGDAVGEVYARLGDSREGDEALKDLTTRALSFADVMKIDVGQAVENAGILMDTGLADSGVEAFDLLTAGAEGLTAVQRDELMAATEEYSQFLAGLGFTGEESFGLLRDAADGGRYMIDKAGDSVKEFTILNREMKDETREVYRSLGFTDEAIDSLQDTITEGGPAAKDAFDNIVTAVQGIEDPSKRSAAAIALFGTPFEDISGDGAKVNDVLNTLANDGIPNAAGASEDLSAAYGNTATNMEVHTRRIQEQLGELTTGYTFAMSYLLSGETRSEFHTAVRDNWKLTAFLAGVDVEGMKQTVALKGGQMVNEVRSWPGRTVSYISGLFEPLKWSVIGASITVSGKVSEIIGTIRSIPGRVGEFGSSLYSAGRDLIEGMVRGVASKASELARRATEVARGAVNAVKNFLGINSPSRVFMEIGGQTMDGLSAGITANGAQVVDAARGIADQVTKAATLTDLTASEAQWMRDAGASLRASRSTVQAPRYDVPQQSAATAAAAAPASVVVHVDARGSLMTNDMPRQIATMVEQHLAGGGRMPRLKAAVR